MDLSLFSLENRIALVTGAGRGIGRAIALGLADVGAHMVVTARTLSEIDDTAIEILKKGGEALSVQADVRDAAQVERLMKETLYKFGRLDILVNNAGAGFVGPTLDFSERAFESMIKENLKSMWLCSQAAAKIMVKQGKGNIISNSSTVGFMPSVGMAIYAAAKAAIINLTRTLAVELASFNIRVNAFAPGIIETLGIKLLEKERPQVMKARLKDIPLGRFGQPEDIVGTVIFLASDASSYITGETIKINGAISNIDMLNP